MGRYVGTFEPDRGALWFETDDGRPRDVAHESDSPLGLAWPGERNAPYDAAMSILADITEDVLLARRWYQNFKAEVVDRLPMDRPFELERSEVEAWLAGQGIAVAVEASTTREPAGAVYCGGFDDNIQQAGLLFRGGDGRRRYVPHVALHSPAGLAWGYEGNGPADTAMSILADITEDPVVAERWHREFEREVVSRLSMNRDFELDRADVERWLAGKGVSVTPEWELGERSPSALAPSPPGVQEPHGSRNPRPVPTVSQLAQRGAALDSRQSTLDAREAALDARERDLDRRDLRAETWESSLRASTGVIEPSWTLPAEPVKAQIETLLVLTHDDLPTVARGINVEPEWAKGVMDGSITEVDLDHVQRLCEGLHCTPYDFWDAESGRSIVHAYGPELWPRYIEPLASPPGPDLGGPELGL